MRPLAIPGAPILVHATKPPWKDKVGSVGLLFQHADSRFVLTAAHTFHAAGASVGGRVTFWGWFAPAFGDAPPLMEEPTESGTLVACAPDLPAPHTSSWGLDVALIRLDDPHAFAIGFGRLDVPWMSPFAVPNDYDLDTEVHVWKMGATTGYTEGLMNRQTEPAFSYGGATAEGLLFVEPAPGYPKFSDGGDSGSLVCDAQGRIVGVHVAGEVDQDEHPGSYCRPFVDVDRWLTKTLSTL